MNKNSTYPTPYTREGKFKRLKKKKDREFRQQALRKKKELKESKQQEQ